MELKNSAGGLRRLLVIGVVAVVLEAYTSTSCLEEERLGLLHIKSYFIEQVKGFPDDYDFMAHSKPKDISEDLGSWRSDDGNCCMWKRVECRTPFPQHVTHLSLDGIWWTNFKYPLFTIDVTLFRPFTHLISLDLSNNSINAMVGDQGNNTLSTLRHMEILNLSYNRNNGLDLEGVMSFVGSLTTLKQFLFGGNNACTGLGFQEVSLRLKQLQVLDCSNCNLRFPQDATLLSQGFPNLTSLQVLDLSYGNYYGNWSAEGLSKLSNLQQLKLPGNNIGGSIPECLWNFTSLQILDLSGNSFTGNLPSFIYLPALERLSLWDNNFQGKTSLNFLMNHSSLQVLFLSNNAIQVEVEDSPFTTTNKLLALGLNHCGIIGDQATILGKILSSQSNMQYIELSSNGLTGSFPTWLLQNNSNLKFLDLGSNSLSGSFQLSKIRNSSILSLDISSNKFTGRLPDHNGMALSSLTFLNMSLNSFEGPIPDSIGNMTQLLILDLSNNNLSGEVPRQLFSGCPLLRVLRLSKNHLHGEIIPSYMNFTSLALLYLDNNHFSGTIKEPLNRHATLTFLDISNNNATGELPSWISDLEWMESLSLAGNQFHGEIPTQLCNLFQLRYLDLSENKFTGTIPSCGGILFLSHWDMHGNSLIGAIPEGLTNCSELETLDLRNNKLSGGIPWWIDTLSNLVILLMGGNQLGGQLPPQLCRLKHVNILDLSNNNFSGALPSCLCNLSFGSPENVTSDFEASIYSEDGSGRNYSYLPEDHSIEVQGIKQVVNLIAKSIYNSYQGKILSVMSALDLSGNNLTGAIPPELGELGLLHALNLSHNRLSGAIPTRFSKLKSIESLDLSSNNLSGTIPSELVDLTFLGTFSVSYNNLSGEVPETGQFGTFDERSYRGNPLLCGSRLPRNCGISKTFPTSSTPTGDKTEEGDEGFDMEVFLWSFGVSSATFFIVYNVVLAINPYWRRAWFAFLAVKFLWWFHYY